MKTKKYYEAMKTTKHECLVVWFDELYNDADFYEILFIELRPNRCFKHLYPKVHSLLDMGV